MTAPQNKTHTSDMTHSVSADPICSLAVFLN